MAETTEPTEDQWEAARKTIDAVHALPTLSAREAVLAEAFAKREREAERRVWRRVIDIAGSVAFPRNYDAILRAAKEATKP